VASNTVDVCTTTDHTVVFAASGKAGSRTARSEHRSLAVVYAVAALPQVAAARVAIYSCQRFTQISLIDLLID